MSLLLDALKKAEQAKREKAAAEAAASPPERPSAGAGGGLELRLEPLPAEGARPGPEGSPGGAPAAGEVAAEPVGPGLAEGGGSTTLRFGAEEAAALTEGAPEARGLDLDEIERRLAESAPPRVDTATLGVADLRAGSATAAHTMPSLKNVQAALKDFYGEATGATPAPPPPGAVSDSTAARPRQAGVEETLLSRKLARNVFAAKQRPARRAGTRWGLLGVSAVLLTALVVGGYYAATSLVSVRPPSLATARPAPVPARPPAAPTAPPAPPAAAVGPAPAAPTAASGSAPAAPAAPTRETVALATPPGSVPAPAPAAPAAPAGGAPAAPVTPPAGAHGPAPGAPAAGARPAPPAAPASAGTPVPAPAPAAAPATTPARPAASLSEEEAYRLARRGPSGPPPAAAARAAEPAPVREALAGGAGEGPALSHDVASRTPRSAPVRVTAHAGEDPIYARLQRAYAAYQVGAYEEARRLYREVLARDPRNRDALLGIGAVAVALGETDRAQAVYGRVLAEDPRDRVAVAAASSVGTGADPYQGEARLRQLLQQDPDAPYLHFALGNHYASQRRWTEAQQAYFDALRADPRNPDYAFNLAVSLDHLGQRRAALDYYRQALDLAERRRAGFSEAAVRQRIERIASAEGTGAP